MVGDVRKAMQNRTKQAKQILIEYDRHGKEDVQAAAAALSDVLEEH